MGLRLNLGSGPVTKAGWVCIDLQKGADLQLDVREEFPFADGSVSILYSEHFFEHLEFPKQTTHFLREAKRVLEKGGLLSLGVPDTEWPLKAYSDDTEGYFPWVRAGQHPNWCRTRLQHLNFHFRQGDEHKYAYDFETLEAVLSQQGFQSIRRRDFDPSLDSAARERGTLYVDARNP